MRQPKQRKPSVAAVNRAFANFEATLGQRMGPAVGAAIQGALDAYHEAIVLPLEARIAALEAERAHLVTHEGAGGFIEPCWCGEVHTTLSSPPGSVLMRPSIATDIDNAEALRAALTDAQTEGLVP